MKKCEYTDQSASELNLALFTGEPPWDELTVLKSGSLKGELEVEAAIIGASHAVTFKIDGVQLSEVFSCAVLEGGRKLATTKIGCQTEVSLNRTLHDAISYEFTAEVCEIDDQSKSRVGKLEDETGQRDVLRLCFEFPENDQVGDLPPVTIVQVSQCEREGRIEVESVHIYPNENVVVFTKTIVKRKDS